MRTADEKNGWSDQRALLEMTELSTKDVRPNGDDMCVGELLYRQLTLDRVFSHVTVGCLKDFHSIYGCGRF